MYRAGEAQWLLFHLHVTLKFSKVQIVHLNIFAMDLRPESTFLYLSPFNAGTYLKNGLFILSAQNEFHIRPYEISGDKVMRPCTIDKQ